MSSRGQGKTVKAEDRTHIQTFWVACVSPLRLNWGRRSLLSRAAINPPYNFKRKESPGGKTYFNSKRGLSLTHREPACNLWVKGVKTCLDMLWRGENAHNSHKQPPKSPLRASLESFPHLNLSISGENVCMHDRQADWAACAEFRPHFLFLSHKADVCAFPTSQSHDPFPNLQSRQLQWDNKYENCIARWSHFKTVLTGGQTTHTAVIFWHIWN